MNEKRNKIKIIHDILISIQQKGGKIKPTHLLYKSNLSYQRMNEYLKELMQKEFVETKQEKDKKYYIITDKGLMFLQEYNKIVNFTESFGL
jgi:predicted transcriptional regulator